MAQISKSPNVQPQLPQNPYVNPNMGKVIGYVYQYPDFYNSEGEFRKGSILTRPSSEAQAIPIYESPIDFKLNNRDLSQQEKYHVAAALAGAEDAEVVDDENKTRSGIINSHFFPMEMRKSLGIPSSFDMIRNLDPTKPDWSAKSWSVFNPKSGGFFGDLAESLASLGPVATLAMMAVGVPPVVAGALMGGSQAYASDGNILKGALTGAAAAGAAPALGSLGSSLSSAGLSTAAEEALREQALSSALSGSASQSLLSGAAIDKALNQALSGAIKGGLTSGVVSAIAGGDPLKAALQGAVSGGVTQGVSSLASPAVATLGLPAPLEKALTGAITGAAKSAVTGKDIGAGALGGGISSGIASLVDQIPGISDLPASLKNALSSGLASAANAAITGDGKPSQAGLIGSILGGVSGLAGQGGAGTAPSAATSGMDLTSMLGLLGMAQQQQAQQAPQQPQVVGQITPYDFSTNLLEGIYQPSRAGLMGANNELLRMARG